jgi:hypothetical protein
MNKQEIESVDWRYNLPIKTDKNSPILKYKLMIKQHWETGINYLCITQKKDYIKYTGSGKRWKVLLNKYPSKINTILLYTSDDKENFDRIAYAWSCYFNVKNNSDYANLIPEGGYGNRYVKRNKKTLDSITHFNIRGKWVGKNSVENKLGIHDPKYIEMRTEWARNAANKLKETGNRSGIFNKEWRENNKEITRELCSTGGKLGGKITGSMFWWNNGTINKRSKECPEGFVRGQLLSEKKISQIKTIGGWNKKDKSNDQ